MFIAVKVCKIDFDMLHLPFLQSSWVCKVQ